MNKRQLIDDIRRHNTTAAPRFLAQFNETALKQYLDHLEDAQQKHTEGSAWVSKNPTKLQLVS